MPSIRHALMLCGVLFWGAATPAQDRQELHWLQRIQQAAQMQNYHGTFVYEQGRSMQSSRIVHLWDGQQSRERLEVLDGQPREIIRQHDEVHSLLPEAKTVLVERSRERETFPALFRGATQNLLDFYRIRHVGMARVAGLETDVLALEPKDNWRYGYKIWADRTTGLLLKAQTLNEKNVVVEQIAFTEIKIGGTIDRNLLKPKHNTDGWKIENTMASSEKLTQWSVAPVVPGFVKVREMRRSLGGQSVGHFVFSDGLAAVSVFIEPWREGKAGPENVGTQGAINMLSRRHGDWSLTVLGEAPLPTIRQFANAVEFKTLATKK